MPLIQRNYGFMHCKRGVSEGGVYHPALSPAGLMDFHVAQGETQSE